MARTVVDAARTAPNAVQAQTPVMSTGASGTNSRVSRAATTPSTTHPHVATPAITAMRLLNSTTAPGASARRGLDGPLLLLRDVVPSPEGVNRSGLVRCRVGRTPVPLSASRGRAGSAGPARRPSGARRPVRRHRRRSARTTRSAASPTRVTGVASSVSGTSTRPVTASASRPTSTSSTATTTTRALEGSGTTGTPSSGRRSTTGSTCPRQLATPRTQDGVAGSRVRAGSGTTSATSVARTP